MGNLAAKDGGIEFTYPAELTRRPNVSLGSSVRVIDATNFPDEIKNLIMIAAHKGSLPNCDALLYTPDNFGNWGRIAAGRSDNGEKEVISRAAEAHARILHPPEVMGFWSIGPGDQFDAKEKLVIEAHLEKGHSFGFFAYSDVNQASVSKSMEDGQRVAQELGLENVQHIPLLGNVFNDKIRQEHKAKLNSDKVQRVMAASFGFTFQNLRTSVSGYPEASSSLQDSLEKVRMWLPSKSRLFVTLDHQGDRETVSKSFEGDAHEEFFRTGVAHHLTDEVANITELRRSFVSRTTILNREGILTETVALNLGDEGFQILEAGSPIWNGISARLPANSAVKAFDAAKLPSVFPDPINNKDKTLACHVAYKR